jgi:RND family efflux transporter MFP subunit
VALADLATLEVEADVNESNVARLGPDQPAEVTAEAFPDRKYKAVLRQVIPTADRTKATVQVKVTIIDKDKDLKPEMSARVTFVEPPNAEKQPAAAAPAAPVLTIPTSAVVTKDGRRFVYEVKEDRAFARTVATGAERSGAVVVREGLAGGEALVMSPPQTLKDGDRVKVKQ